MYSPENSEGQIITLIEGPINNRHKWPVYFRHPSIDKEINDADFLHLLSLAALKAGIAVNSYEKNIIDFLKPRFDFYQNRLQNKYGSEVVQLILEQRLKMILLINSPGGSAFECGHVVRAMGYIQAKGGLADTLVSSKAMSGAADIFSKANNRFVINISELMFHDPYFESKDLDLDSKVKASELNIRSFENIKNLRRFFQLHLEGPKLKAILDKIDEITLDDNWELNFSGEEMATLEIATAFPTIDELANHFSRKTNIILSQLEQKDPRRKFFNKRNKLVKR